MIPIPPSPPSGCCCAPRRPRISSPTPRFYASDRARLRGRPARRARRPGPSSPPAAGGWVLRGFGSFSVERPGQRPLPRRGRPLPASPLSRARDRLDPGRRAPRAAASPHEAARARARLGLRHARPRPRSSATSTRGNARSIRLAERLGAVARRRRRPKLRPRRRVYRHPGPEGAGMTAAPPSRPSACPPPAPDGGLPGHGRLPRLRRRPLPRRAVRCGARLAHLRRATSAPGSCWASAAGRSRRSATGAFVGQVSLNHPPHFPEREIGWLLFPASRARATPPRRARAVRAFAYGTSAGRPPSAT